MVKYRNVLRRPLPAGEFGEAIRRISGGSPPTKDGGAPRVTDNFNRTPRRLEGCKWVRRCGNLLEDATYRRTLNAGPEFQTANLACSALCRVLWGLLGPGPVEVRQSGHYGAIHRFASECS